MKSTKIFKILTLLAMVCISQVSFGQYVKAEEAITRLQTEVVKYEAQQDPVGGSGLVAPAFKTPPSYYVRIMKNMIEKITAEKRVAPSIEEWEQISLQSSANRKVAIAEVLTFVKALLK